MTHEHHTTTLGCRPARGTATVEDGRDAPPRPELLVTAKTQRWNPEEFLRTLVEAETNAREESNARATRRLAAFR